MLLAISSGKKESCLFCKRGLRLVDLIAGNRAQLKGHAGEGTGSVTARIAAGVITKIISVEPGDEEGFTGANSRS